LIIARFVGDLFFSGADFKSFKISLRFRGRNC
jgi:hypothetical protein